LPSILPQLIRGIDNPRANLSRLCVDTARHIHSGGSADPALASDIVEATKLIPGASIEWLIEQIPGFNEYEVISLVEKVANLLDPEEA
jgi:hypothetical protein